MTRIDLDDLPPRIAAKFKTAAVGEELLLVENGLVVARLTLAGDAAAAAAQGDPNSTMEEVLDHFKSIIEDEF